jgi:hypothetical protein
MLMEKNMIKPLPKCVLHQEFRSGFQLQNTNQFILIKIIINS